MSENAVDRFGRTTYTRAQLEQYFQHISLPAETAATLLDPASRPTLESLATLIKYQLCAVPFESLALHYNPNHDVNINPQYLFQKIVGNGRGRGGYCMENNTFFGTVLRSLRFDVLSTGARINGEVANEKLAANEEEERGTYMGWSHMVNIVEIDGKRYQVDVGFGSSGPTHPVLLNKDEPTSLVNVGKQEIRLIYEAISDGTHREKNWWIYQFRHTPELPWVRAYCFDDQIEFLPDDFRVMNIGTSTGTGLFTMNVLCMKMLMEEGKIVGDCTLFGAQVKKRINGVPGTPEVCTNEEERVTAFKNWLQVTFTDEEMKAIKGWKTELKPGSPCRNER